MQRQILQLLQPVQVRFQLRVAPAGKLPHGGPRKAVVQPLDLEPFAFRRHHLVDQQQQAARLRRHVVKRAHQNMAR